MIEIYKELYHDNILNNLIQLFQIKYSCHGYRLKLPTNYHNNDTDIINYDNIHQYSFLSLLTQIKESFGLISN